MNFKDSKNFKNSKCFLKCFGIFRQVERISQIRFWGRNFSLSLSLSLSLASFLFVIYFFNPLNLFTRFSLFARRKFIKFTRKFINLRHFLTKFTTFITFHFYGYCFVLCTRNTFFATQKTASLMSPRLEFARLAMMANFSQKLKTTAISTPNAFKISKNSTQRNSYE